MNFSIDICEKISIFILLPVWIILLITFSIKLLLKIYFNGKAEAEYIKLKLLERNKNQCQDEQTNEMIVDQKPEKICKEDKKNVKQQKEGGSDLI